MTSPEQSHPTGPVPPHTYGFPSWAAAYKIAAAATHRCSGSRVACTTPGLVDRENGGGVLREHGLDPHAGGSAGRTGGTGDGLPMTRAAAGGKLFTRSSLIWGS